MNAMQQEEQLQLFENYGLWHTPFWQKTWFMIVVALGAVLLCAGLLYAYLVWRRSKKIVLSPTEQALYDLKMLKNKGLCSIESCSPFYAALTAILKRYLSNLYMHDLRSNTDQQMIERIADMPLFDAQKIGLTDIFSAGELIKFARQDALEEQMKRDWQFAFDFITAVQSEMNRSQK